MVKKSANDTAGPNNLIFILLVFGIYFHVTNNFLSFLKLIKYTAAINKKRKELRKINAGR